MNVTSKYLKNGGAIAAGLAAHYRRFKNPVVRGVYGAQRAFLRGSLDLGLELADVVGQTASYSGYFLTLTGVGAPIGIPMAEFGNNLSFGAGSIKVTLKVINNNFNKGWTDAGFVMGSRLIGKTINRIPLGNKLLLNNKIQYEILKGSTRLKLKLGKWMLENNPNK